MRAEQEQPTLRVDDQPPPEWLEPFERQKDEEDPDRDDTHVVLIDM